MFSSSKWQFWRGHRPSGPLSAEPSVIRPEIPKSEPKLIDPARAWQTVAVWRGWDKLESIIAKQTGKKIKVEVIDSDVTGIDPAVIREFPIAEFGPDEPIKARYEIARARREVEIDLENLILSFEGYVNNFPVDDQRLDLYDGLVASRWFLEVQKYPLQSGDFVAKTMGIAFRHISEDEIKVAREGVREALTNLGYPSTNLAEAFNNFRNDHLLNPVQIKEKMVTATRRRLPKLQEYLGFGNVLHTTFSRPGELIEEFYKPEVDYRMESRYQKGKQRLRVNTAKKFTEGDPEYFVTHELGGHGIDIEMLKIHIEQEKVIRELGIRTLHGPQVYAREGGAMALHHFLPADFFQITPEEGLIYHWRELFWLVLNNAHLKMFDSGTPEQKLQDAVRYAKDRMKILSREEIEGSLSIRLEEALERTHDYVYGVAMLDFQQIAQNLGNDENRRRFLQRYYGWPLIPAHVHQLAEEIKQAA